MIKASQEALIQQASRDIILIQRKELEHFKEILNKFAFQGALFGGFILQVICNVNVNEAEVGLHWKWLFWLCLDIVFTISLTVLLGTKIAGIYAPGLALRGPAGSMVRALDGLIKETEKIFRFFFLMVIMFQLCNFSLCYIVMYENCAILCSLIFIGGLYVWYYQCLRIYNRFKYDRFALEAIEEDINLDPTVEDIVPMSQNSLPDFSSDDISKHQIKSLKPLPPHSTLPSIITTTTTTTTLQPTLTSTSISSSSSSNIKSNNNYGGSDVSQSTQQSANSVPTQKVKIVNFKEGYLTYKSSSSGLFFSIKWNRVYVVLNQTDLYFYQSKSDYELKPKQTLKNRPISLIGYIVQSFQGPQGELQINLTPLQANDERRTWEFRVDTIDELNEWCNALEKIGEITKSYSQEGSFLD